MAFPPTFDNVWDITQPPDTQAANLLGQDIRNLKDDIMQRISLLAGTFANRPTPETVNATWGGSGYGLLYFATDTLAVYQWTGSAWQQINFGTVGSVNSLAVTASTALATLFTPAAAGFFEIPFVIAGSATAGPTATATLTISYTIGGVVKTQTYTISLASSGYFARSGVINLYCDAATPVQWSFTISTGTFNVNVRLRGKAA